MSSLTELDALWAEVTAATTVYKKMAQPLVPGGHWYNAQQIYRQLRGELATPTPAPTPAPAPVPDVSSIASTRYYATASIWNQPVPVPAPIHPDSGQMIGGNPDWVGGLVGGHGWLRLEREEIDVYVPDATPTVTVWVDYNEQTGSYVLNDHSVEVPIPGQFEASVVKQPYTDTDRKGTFTALPGDQWGFGKLTAPDETPYVVASGKASGVPKAGWHCVRMDYSPAASGKGWAGAYGYSLGSWDAGELHNRATLVSNVAGMLRPRDLRTGIDHALAFVCPFFATPGGLHPAYVKPASGGDGQRTGLSAIPQGARLILDPSLDVAAWCASHNEDGTAGSVPVDKQRWLLPILWALQIYGMVGVDSTGVGSPPSGAIVCNHTGANALNESGYHYPWETQSYGWTYANSVPIGLMSRFQVIDWTKWT